MTRLKTEWIEDMVTGMNAYNVKLKSKIGCNLLELASYACNKNIKSIDAEKVAVVPITQGEGIIGSFSESIASIVKSMGFDAKVMDNTDVTGIYDSFVLKRNIIFMADDTRYVAINNSKNKLSDNNYGTALGYVCALSKLMEKHGLNIKDEKILLIGYGIVGREAVKIMISRGISFDIYDKNQDVIKDLSYYKLHDKSEIKNYKYILDFTNEGGWISKMDLAKDTLYATPGVPYSLNDEACQFFEERSVHDNLEIGTAVMMVDVLD